MDPFASALIAELGKKTSVCWLRYTEGYAASTEHAAWHVWHDDALLLVSGGGEQPLPGISDADRVRVTMRSKDNGGRLVTWEGTPQRVLPTSDAWAGSVAALAAARISIPSLTETPVEWERTAVVTRLEPDAVVEHPDDLSADSHAAAPRPTPAITRGPLPRILHRRKTRRPELS